MKKIIIFILFVVVFFTFTSTSFAINDPTQVLNNKYGIHILNENDLEDAKNLVNSNGGDWGYVTVVITEAERDSSRWQNVFDKMRRLHLIPIVRVATSFKDGVWESPKIEDIDNWVAFLSSLNWVTQNRYVAILNEPNHAKEWGGTINPKEYALYLKEFSIKLKASSPDYFVLQAGFDASANNSKQTMSIERYLQQMQNAEPEIFNYIDGWNSHSYPNPAFSGKPVAIGKGTVASYKWELEYLRSLRVTKNLPIFITETGWSNKNLTDEEIAKNMEHAFKNVWNDNRIVAVTPFVLNYTTEPFEEFSWKNDDGSFKSFYHKTIDLPKIKGGPVQVVKGEIIGIFVNPFVIAGHSMSGTVLAKNLGQSIWVSPEIEVSDKSQNLIIKTDKFYDIEPQRLGLIKFDSNQLNSAATFNSSIVLQNNSKAISNEKELKVLVIEPTKLKNLSFFGKLQRFVRNLFN